MHTSAYSYVEQWVRKLQIENDVILEVGSRNINGTVRELFGGPYEGVDMLPGPCVDVVAFAADLPYPDKHFDVVVCTEMLEHDITPWLSIVEMARVARKYVIITARGYDERGCTPIHDYPGDYWRFSVEGLRALLRFGNLDVIDCIMDPGEPGVCGIGRVI